MAPISEDGAQLAFVLGAGSRSTNIAPQQETTAITTADTEIRGNLVYKEYSLQGQANVMDAWASHGQKCFLPVPPCLGANRPTMVSPEFE